MSELWDCCVCQSWWMWDFDWHVPHRSSAQRQTIWNIEQGLPVFSCSRVNSGFQLICSRVQTMGGGRWSPWWVFDGSVSRQIQLADLDSTCRDLVSRVALRSLALRCMQRLNTLDALPFAAWECSIWKLRSWLVFFSQASKMGNSCNSTIFQTISPMSHFSNKKFVGLCFAECRLL